MPDTVLVTGGCGFIGTNLAERLLHRGFRVRILDNLSRSGSELNRLWLMQSGDSARIDFIPCDVRDAKAVRQAVEGVDYIFHFAAQVAVTTSVTDPRTDLDVNIVGTFNVLEAARAVGRHPLVIFTSTNKVYGETEQIPIRELPTRYGYADRRPGISESQPLDFHSPYGCSKGSADQYVHDYFRIYDVPTVVLRMSCIYGPHQFGNEDQGWVAHFLISVLNQRPLTIYGDGKQVRDILYIGDLLDLFELLLANRTHVAGKIFNVGGGTTNSISVWCEFGPLIANLVGREFGVQHGPWRPGDQKVYISDIRRAARELGWTPQVRMEDGIKRLLGWLESQMAAAGHSTNGTGSDSRQTRRWLTDWKYR